MIRQIRLAFGWLVICSLFFYAWWNPAYLGLLLGSIVFNYCLALWIAKNKRFSLVLLIIGIAINLAALAWFKYAGFLVNNINSIFNLELNDLNIILPLAISFFTFQQIAFLVDCHRGVAREYHFLDYVLFVGFFPQLIAGPIVHHNDVIPQFRQLRNKPYDFTNLQVGLTVLMIGLFKKVVIADGLAEMATPIFTQAENGEDLTIAYAWLGALSYTFQLYFDFSGYCDMAIGAARLFGIRLPENFSSPYKSKSIIEFWRRWHITLSRFLKDYLYISLGGNRKGYVQQLTNLMITMLLGGLWHGAGWTFVFWGGLHGAYLVINHLWQRFGGGLRQNLIKRRWYDATSWLICFVAVTVAWVFFRAESFEGARVMLTAMANVGDIFASTPVLFAAVPDMALLLLVVAMIIAWCFPNVQQWMARENLVLSTEGVREAKVIWQPSWYWAALTASLGAMALYKLVYIPNAVTEFIYFQF